MPAMQIGELFTRSRRGETIVTEPCEHCGEPSVAIEHDKYTRTHFEVAPSGARTAWPECRTGDQGALFGMLA